MPSALTDDPTSFPTVTTPVDADTPNGAAFQVTNQQLANRTAYLNARSFTAALAEGFETACPPTSPSGLWTGPSKRYNTDFSFFRDTTTPLVGTASANRSASQTASTNSSLGLDWYFDSPGRLAFYFDVLCNSAGGDSLQFYVDGVLTAQINTPTNTQNAAGRFVTDVLSEGAHTFDWRFLRGASVSVAGEKSRIDLVEVVPESRWLDLVTRIFSWTDFLSGVDFNAGTAIPLWQAGSSGTAGTIAGTSLVSQSFMGAMQLTTGAGAAGDTEAAIHTNFLTSFDGAFAKPIFFETKILLPSLTNVACSIGIADTTLPTHTNGVEMIFDSTIGTTWRLKTTVGGVSNTYDTGIVADTNAHRIGINFVATLGVCMTYDGKSVPSNAANTTTATSLDIPLISANMSPIISVSSRTAAAAKIIYSDWARVMQLR